MRILLGSHGHFASGIKTALQILIGKDAEKVVVIDAYVDDVNIDEELRRFFDETAEDETVLMLSDLYGGSVNQKMYLYLQRPHTYLVAGINLALVIELCLKDSISAEQLKEMVEIARANADGRRTRYVRCRRYRGRFFVRIGGE